MRKIIVTILTFVLCVVLMLNFARLIMYVPRSSEDQFAFVSTQTVLQAVSEFEIKDTGILYTFGDIFESFLDIGESFTTVFSVQGVEGKNIFQVVKNFFNSIVTFWKRSVKIIGDVVVLLVSVVIYLSNALFAIFKFLNTILGFSLPTTSTQVSGAVVTGLSSGVVS